MMALLLSLLVVRGIVFADRQGCLVQTAWYVGGDRRVTSRRRHFGSLQHGEMPRWCGDWSRSWGSTTACGGQRSTLSTFKASRAALDVAVLPRLFFSGVEWMRSVDAVFGIFVEWKVATACTSDRQCQPLIAVPCRLPTPPLRLVEPQAGGRLLGGEHTLICRLEQRVAELVCR